MPCFRGFNKFLEDCCKAGQQKRKIKPRGGFNRTPFLTNQKSREISRSCKEVSRKTQEVSRKSKEMSRNSKEVSRKSEEVSSSCKELREVY
jgi:hypothetical protein